jgi:CheY-like chemotaxis protein
MERALHILLIEDNPLDTCLIERELGDAHIAFRLTRIESESQLRRELMIDRPDLILSDHNLPSFDGFTALRIVRERFPRMPFIFVSGSNDQQMIVEMFERGATDYVFKRDLNDLRKAVNHALDDSYDVPAPKVQLTSGFPAKSDFTATTGNLIFCPECLQAWDEEGRAVLIERYLRSHAESFVIRQTCIECGNSKRAD